MSVTRRTKPQLFEVLRISHGFLDNGIVGELTEKRCVLEIEWRIPYCLLDPKTDGIENFHNTWNSPQFCCLCQSWFLRFNRNITHESNCEIGLSLVRSDYKFPVLLSCTLLLKSPEGKKLVEQRRTYPFDSSKDGHPILESFPIKRNCFFLNTDVLTIICCIENPNNTNMTSKLQEDLGQLLLSGEHTDVTLNVQGREFKSHRTILAARSSVFKAMMSHQMTENRTGIVTIEDSDPDAFPEFLRYLYTGEAENLTVTNSLSLYVTADKYEVEQLKSVCLGRMAEGISIDNFCDVLTLSLRNQERELTNTATRFFLENSEEIVVSAKWQSFLIENPIAANELIIKLIQKMKQ